MKNVKRISLIAFLMLLASTLTILTVQWLKKEPPKPDSTPSIELSLLQDLSTFKSKEIVYKDSIKKLTAVIDRLNKKGIPAVVTNWNNATSNYKKLTTDDKMLMLQEYFEWSKKLGKILINKDTLVTFDQYQFNDVGGLTVENDFMSIMIDSLHVICEYYALNENQFMKQIDNLNYQNAANEKRVLVKEDHIKKLNSVIFENDKAAIKQKRRSFFNGLGLGIGAGIVGTLVLILSK